MKYPTSFIRGGFVLALSLSFVGLALAEGSNKTTRRGMITSSNCPFSCLDLGLKSDECRQWTSGSKCYVEDYTQPAGHRSMFRIRTDQYISPNSSSRSNAKKNISQNIGSRTNQVPRSALSRRGLVTSASCPYNCKHTGLPKDLCRDWRAGNKCYTEDYTQVPGHRSMIRIPK